MRIEEALVRKIPLPARYREYRWRPWAPADVPGMRAAMLAADEFDGTDRAKSQDELALLFQDHWLHNLENFTLLVESGRGEVAAFGVVLANPEPQNHRRALPLITVHPEHRGGGLQEYFLRWAILRGEQVLAGIEADLPAVLRLGVPDTLTERISLLEKHGFRPVRYHNRMRRKLSEPIPDLPLSGGLALTTYRPELEWPLHAAFNETFSDHWGFEPVDEKDWDMWFIGRASFRPDLTYLAMDGQEIAGFAMNGIDPERNARSGVKEGWVHELGTRRPWRRQGVARALLALSMRAFQADGMDYATLGVDTQNTTGALRIYERLGFTAVNHFISYEKPLLEAGPPG